jgi:hypothetical protein
MATQVAPEEHGDQAFGSGETRCPYCAELILVQAKKCKHCGELLDADLRAAATPPLPRKWSPGVAALLSLVIPGAGQMYKGQVGSGLVWFFCIVTGYFLLVVPGFVLHIICIFTAASGDPTK